jgi:predicted DNA binding CopG/RHH family protein
MEPQRKARAPRPDQRTRTKLSSRLLRKARMVAASQGVDVQEYLEAVLRPVLERDYKHMFLDSLSG